MKAALTWIARKARLIGPYVLIELLLPGGTLLAIFLWLSRYRRRPAFNQSGGKTHDSAHRGDVIGYIRGLFRLARGAGRARGREGGSEESADRAWPLHREDRGVQRLSHGGVRAHRRQGAGVAMADRGQARLARPVGHDVSGQPAALHAAAHAGPVGEGREKHADAAADAVVCAA